VSWTSLPKSPPLRPMAPYSATFPHSDFCHAPFLHFTDKNLHFQKNHKKSSLKKRLRDLSSILHLHQDFSHLENFIIYYQHIAFATRSHARSLYHILSSYRIDFTMITIGRRRRGINFPLPSSTRVFILVTALCQFQCCHRLVSVPMLAMSRLPCTPVSA